MSDHDTAALAAIPARHAQPDADTLAYLPKGGAQLAYMGHAEVTLALIDADPQWTWEPLAIDDGTGGPLIHEQGKRLIMWARLTVCGKSMIGVGTCDAGKGDPEKELIGDFLRNAAMRFGIGTKLWSKATDADPAGSGRSGGSYRRGGTPTPEPTISAAAHDLFARCKAVKGTAVADELRRLAAENGTAVSAAAFDADPRWAELVAATLDADAAPVDGEMFGGEG